MSRSLSPTLVTKYTLCLPEKKLLEDKVIALFETIYDRKSYVNCLFFGYLCQKITKSLKKVKKNKKNC